MAPNPTIDANKMQGRAETALSKTRRTAILKALADPHRFGLLETIARSSCPLNCSEVRTALPISAATLSHHVKELQRAGLIEVQAEGKFHFLTIRPDVIEKLILTLTPLAGPRCRPSRSKPED